MEEPTLIKKGKMIEGYGWYRTKNGKKMTFLLSKEGQQKTNEKEIKVFFYLAKMHPIIMFILLKMIRSWVCVILNTKNFQNGTIVSMRNNLIGISMILE